MTSTSSPNYQRPWFKYLSTAAVGSVLASGLALSAPSAANAAMVASDVNVYGYCRSLGFATTYTANAADPYSWYCIGNGRSPRRLWGSDMTQACRRIAGPYVYARLVANNAWGWRCFR